MALVSVYEPETQGFIGNIDHHVAAADIGVIVLDPELSDQL